jgi:hypothetical protein
VPPVPIEIWIFSWATAEPDTTSNAPSNADVTDLILASR